MEQFGFMRGRSCADAGISLDGTILFALDQRAEVPLISLDIKGAFDRVWWKGLLCHVGLHGRAFELFKSCFSNHCLYVVTANGISSSVPISAEVVYGHLCFLIYTPA